MVCVAALATCAKVVDSSTDDRHLNQVGGERRQPIVMALRPAVPDGHVAAVDIAGLRHLVKFGNISGI
jgi:hypothetical protein